MFTEYVYPFELASVILLVGICRSGPDAAREENEQVGQPLAAGLRESQGPRARAADARREERLTRHVSAAGLKTETKTGWRRAHHPMQKNQGGTLLTLSHFLILGAILFAISVVGIFLNRKNLIIILMSIELMLLAVNMNFIAFSHYLQDLAGQVFVFFILTVAAAESAIGLAILVVLFRNLKTIHVDDLDSLKG
jgi:NADH-quinone oxidoreductase subunit K